MLLLVSSHVSRVVFCSICLELVELAILMAYEASLVLAIMSSIGAFRFTSDVFSKCMAGALLSNILIVAWRSSMLGFGVTRTSVFGSVVVRSVSLDDAIAHY